MATYTNPNAIKGYYLGYDLDQSDYCTRSQVKVWISEYSVLIDVHLRRRYNLPITNANDLVYLKMLCELFVVGKIDGIMRAATSDTDDENKKYLRNRNCTKEANQMLQDLISGVTQLETAAKSLTPIAYLQGDYD